VSVYKIFTVLITYKSVFYVNIISKIIVIIAEIVSEYTLSFLDI